MTAPGAYCRHPAPTTPSFPPPTVIPTHRRHSRESGNPHPAPPQRRPRSPTVIPAQAGIQNPGKPRRSGRPGVWIPAPAQAPPPARSSCDQLRTNGRAAGWGGWIPAFAGMTVGGGNDGWVGRQVWRCAAYGVGRRMAFPPHPTLSRWERALRGGRGFIIPYAITGRGPTPSRPPIPSSGKPGGGIRRAALCVRLAALRGWAGVSAGGRRRFGRLSGSRRTGRWTTGRCGCPRAPGPAASGGGRRFRRSCLLPG